MKNRNSSETLRMKFIAGELQGLRKVVDFLYDGNPNAFNILFFLKGNYKQWPDMFNWLAKNKIKGQDLVEMFQNESPDGGGFHLGATFILNKLKGHNFRQEHVKAWELR